MSTTSSQGVNYTRFASIALLGVAAALAAWWALIYGDGAAVPLLVDPGVLVRWGLPVSMLVLRVSSGITLGALLLAAFALPSTHKAYDSSMTLAGWSAAVWTVSSVAAGLLTFSAVYLEPVTLDDRYGNLLSIFFAQTEIGRAWLWSTVFAGATTIASIAAAMTACGFTVSGSSGATPWVAPVR